MEFKNVYPGQKVVIRGWDDMAMEYGVRRTGSIDCPYGFHPVMMKDTCGEVATVVSIQLPDAFTLLMDGEDEPRVDAYHPCTFRPLTWEDCAIGLAEKEKPAAKPRLKVVK